MIEFENLSAFYGKKKVLKNISLTAENGEITIILGKNGSGKSTLFRTLTGLLGYTGSVRADGSEVKSTSANRRGKLIALMPQQLAKPQITVRELVSYGRQPYTGFSGILSKDDDLAVCRAMEQTQTDVFSDTPADKISGGELQRAYLAMIMAQNAPNLALDEPCSHLDPEYGKRTAEFLQNAANEGKAVLAIYHDLNQAMEIAHKIAVLREGELIFFGSPKDFADSDLPESLFSLRRFECEDESGTKRVFFA